MDSLSESPGTLYGTVSVLREFGRYLYRHGYKDAYIIPDNTVAQQTPAPPYFFTQSEIDEFFCAVDTVEPHPRFSGREYIVPAFSGFFIAVEYAVKKPECFGVQTFHLGKAGLMSFNQKVQKLAVYI